VIDRTRDSLRSLPPINCESLELQGKNKCIAEMISTASSYRSKFELVMTDNTNNTFDHFLDMQDRLEKYPNFAFETEKYVTEICSLIQDFGNRVCDSQKKIRTVAEYLSFPFKSDKNFTEIAATICENYSLSKPSLENEKLTFKNYICLKTRAGQESFWKLVPRHKFPNLRRCSEIVHSCFGSTYLCESGIYYLKMTKSKQRSNITDEYLQDSLRLAFTHLFT
jgi:hypothetical protein